MGGQLNSYGPQRFKELWTEDAADQYDRLGPDVPCAAQSVDIPITHCSSNNLKNRMIDPIQNYVVLLYATVRTHVHARTQVIVVCIYSRNK